MVFQQKLDEAVEKNNSLLCVGLDPDLGQLPQRFRKTIHPQFTFNKWIIDQTHDLVCCYKPNSAFYEARGAEGISELKMTCDYIRGQYPEIPILLDFKRGDIGNTNEAYAKFAFEYLGVDGVTVNPYLGHEALQPFLARKEKGIFILCKTSNAGAGEFQDVIVTSSTSRLNLEVGQTLSEYIAYQVVQHWNTNNNCFLVVGATYPEELKKIRRIVGDMTILVPGVGAQEGDIAKTVKAGLNSRKAGMIINSSRGVVFAKNPRAEALKLRDAINRNRKI